MKNLLTISVLLTALMFSSTSHAEWTWVAEGTNGNTYYVDLERIRKNDGYIYFWTLLDLLKPTKVGGDLSAKIYRQGDCKNFRYKSLSYVYHKKRMGRGRNEVDNTPEDWNYPPPDSVVEHVLKTVCNQ